MRIRERRSRRGAREWALACRIGGAIAALLLLAVGASGCGAGGLFQQYEYEEDMYLSLDGSATLYVNSSIAALNALRGTSFNASPAAPFDPAPFRAYFTTPDSHVVRVSQSRRSGRRFVHVRLEIADVRTLGSSPPFAWSSYAFGRQDASFVYHQVVGPPAGGAAYGGWNGREVVAFRLHLPSKIESQNTPDLRRGNILVWEQPLADRLRGAPLTLDVRMQTESILYRTLYLFGLTFVAVALTFVAVIWLILKRGSRAADPAQPTGGV
jgi:hypothetical protein